MIDMPLKQRIRKEAYIESISRALISLNSKLVLMRITFEDIFLLFWLDTAVNNLFSQLKAAINDYTVTSWSEC